MLSNPFETIEWIEADDELPISLTSVLVFVPSSNINKVFVAFYDDQWLTNRTCEPIEETVIAWAPMPSGPKRNDEAEDD